MDYEDVIGGGSVKTRFKYSNVPSADYGLTEEEIFLLDDKHLNQLVSLKHYRPYRHVKVDEAEDKRPGKKTDVNVHAVIARKKEFRKEVNERLDLAKQLTLADHENEKQKQLASIGGKKDKHKDKTEQLLKKRNRKEAKRDRGETKADEQDDEVDEAEATKRKRLALYGL